MIPLDAQFAVLREAYPNADLTKLPNGAAIITLPDVPLPPGWSKQSLKVRFLAPIDYPMATPDCFWVDADLRLSNGGMPHATNMQPIPDTNESLLWVSWHVGKWNPNRDNLATYAKVVERRLKEVR